MANDNSVQVRSLVKGVFFGVSVSPRTVLWVTPDKARHLIENKLAEYITGPSVQPVAAPKETKPVEAESKKFSSDTPDSLSTDLAASGVSGAEALSSAQRVAPASQPTKPIRSVLGLPKRR